jgi:glycosyltransferase involved in cell wall biosynthesis
LHTHLPRADFVGAIGHLVFASMPWVCSIHDIYEESWSGKWTLPLFNLIWRRPDVVISISHAVKLWLVQKRHIPPGKVTVIHYGIEPEHFNIANFGSDLRKSWNMNGNAIIGSIGRLEARKGHGTLIKAMPLILQKVANAILLIAGHDPWGYGEKLENMIHELKLDGKVKLMGFQNDIPSFLHAIDVFAFASTSEGFGQVVIEAMAAGKPVIASRVAPLTEIVLDGQTGVLVESDNPEAFARAGVWLLQKAKEARRMGIEGQRHVSNQFNAKNMSDRILSVYTKLLGIRHGSAEVF